MTIKINKTKKQEVVKMKNYKKYEGIYDVDVEKFQEVFSNVFDGLLEKFEEFVETPYNTTEAEDLDEWLNEGWVTIYVYGNEVEYIPEWCSKNFKGDDLPWLRDDISDVIDELEMLKNLRRDW